MNEAHISINLFVYRDVSRQMGNCDVEAIKLRDGRVVVIATERKDNSGMSITNAVECVATAVCKHLEIDPHRLVWIEHYGYPASAGLPKRTYDRATFARITPDELRFFHDPTWSVMKESDWHALGLPPRD